MYSGSMTLGYRRRKQGRAVRPVSRELPPPPISNLQFGRGERSRENEGRAGPYLAMSYGGPLGGWERDP